jgi:hypothetical protein
MRKISERAKSEWRFVMKRIVKADRFKISELLASQT